MGVSKNGWFTKRKSNLEMDDDWGYFGTTDIDWNIVVHWHISGTMELHWLKLVMMLHALLWLGYTPGTYEKKKIPDRPSIRSQVHMIYRKT